jgi:hypothetical protein
MKLICYVVLLASIMVSLAPAQSVSVLGLTKTRHHDQTAAGTTAFYEYSLRGFVEGQSLSASFPSPSNRFTRSGGGPYVLGYVNGRWDYEEFFSSKALLDAAFPNTSYDFLVGASPAVSLTFASDGYPTQPVITVSAGTWHQGRLLISPAQAASGFTLTSNPSNGNGFLTLQVFSSATDIVDEVVTLNPGLDATISGTVPPGSLEIQQFYDVHAEFDHVTSSASLTGQTWAAPNSFGYALFSSNTWFEIEVLNELTAWRLQYLGTIENTGTAADDADADGDGIVNAMEFATGQHPATRGVLNTSVTRTGGNVEFVYPRNVAAFAAGTEYFVEWSDSLPGTSWSTVGVVEEVQSDNGTLQQIKATLPAGTGNKRFVRLRITLPAPIE